MNSKLPPMTTNYRAIPLQSGQTLAVGRLASSSLFLAEGEVLLHAPPQWLGDTVVLAPPRRVAAPAAIAGDQVQSLTALAAVKLQVEVAASPLERLRAAWQALRFPPPAPAR